MTLSTMASVASKVRAARDPDETEESGGEEPTTTPLNGIKWMEKPVAAVSGDADLNSTKDTTDRPQAKGVVEAFGEVRALLWREEWMRAQIELLSQQRDQMARALEKVMNEKAPVLLVPPPTKKRKLEGLSALSAPSGGFANSAASPRGDTSQTDSPREDGEGSGNAWGCMRAVDWQQMLAGRRRLLVQSVVPLNALPPLESAAQESRKRWRASAAHYQLHRHRAQAEEEGGGRAEGKQRGGGVRNSPHSAHVPAHPSSNRKGAHARAAHLDSHGGGPDSPAVHKQSGSVLKGGRAVVTPGGQKVVIKFSATKPPPQVAAARGGVAPGSPAHTPLAKYKNGAHRGHGAGSEPGTPVLSAQKKHKSVLSLVTQSKTGSPRISPSANPSTPRGADWGIDDYVYGGPRTHTKIEIVKAKEIETPKWHVIRRENPAPVQKKEGGRGSRSLSVGSKYAKVKPAHLNGQNGVGAAAAGAGDGSSEEETDDETYERRHRPFEEQETKYRFPNQQEREKKHLEALKKEGGFISGVDSEQAYKSLWYRGDSSHSLDLDASAGSNGKVSKHNTPTPRAGGSDADTASPRPMEVDGGSRKSTPRPSEEGSAPAAAAATTAPAAPAAPAAAPLAAPLLDDVDAKNGKSRKAPPCDRVLVTG